MKLVAVSRESEAEAAEERRRLSGARGLRSLALLQAVDFAATGLWSLIDLDSFQRVTGLKKDDWLVKTVGTLVTGIGLTIGLAAYHRRITPETAVLAAGSSAGLATIDLYYAARGRISRVYLLDALVQAAFVGSWIWLQGRQRRAEEAGR